MKKLISCILALTMMILLVPCVFAAEEEPEFFQAATTNTPFQAVRHVSRVTEAATKN